MPATSDPVSGRKEHDGTGLNIGLRAVSLLPVSQCRKPEGVGLELITPCSDRWGSVCSAGPRPAGPGAVFVAAQKLGSILLGRALSGPPLNQRSLGLHCIQRSSPQPFWYLDCFHGQQFFHRLGGKGVGVGGGMVWG